MSKQLSMDAVRRSNRYRVIMNLPIRMGLKRGTLVDISSAGVLATHPGVLNRGALVEISFTYEGEFKATAKVASCTVVGLGGGETTLYASRLYFTNLSEQAKQMLDSLFGEPEQFPET
jgi:PilZ domain-containing protein